MRKEKNRLIGLTGISVLCFLLNLKVGALVFGVMALFKGVKYLQDPNRRLKDRILEDAKTWEVNIPESFIIRKKLFEVYRRIQVKEKMDPIFITSFALILDEFWQQSSRFLNESEWREGISFLDRNIPKPVFDKTNLTEALSEMQNLNFQYEKATIEVQK